MIRCILNYFFFSLASSVAFSQTYYPLYGLQQALLIDWSNTNLITTDNDWSNVPYLRGFRGDGLTSTPNVDPRTVTNDGTNTTVVIYANQTDPNTFNADGFAEFETLSNPTIAFRASNTANAPFLMFYINTLNPDWGFIPSIRFLLRDIDGTASNAVQQVSVQYRVGETGPFVPAREFFHVLPGGDYFSGYHPDATKGPFLSGHESFCEFLFPPACENQPKVQIRVMITNSTGGNEWVGIDDIRFGGGQLLPIKLESFSAFDKTGFIELNWKANNDNIQDQFEIEKSSDGLNYHTLASVHAKGLGNHEYKFIDASPLIGISFYRLKLKNADGKFTYSNTLSVKHLAKDIYISSLYPIPAGSKLNLIIFSKEETQIRLRIVDLAGSILKKISVKLDSGTNKLPIDISYLSPGNYFITAIVNEGVLSEKFIKF